MRLRKTFTVLAAGVMAALSFVALPTTSGATAVNELVSSTGTATVTGGALTFTVPAGPAFTATLAGVDQNVTQNQVFEVSDATGSGAGWNITATSTTFTGAHTMSTTAVTEQVAPVAACDASVTCAVATYGAVVTYPYTLPAAGSAPTATKMVSAQVNSGMGNQSSTNIMQLSVPAKTFNGSYTSTWTYTLATGP